MDNMSDIMRRWRTHRSLFVGSHYHAVTYCVVDDHSVDNASDRWVLSENMQGR